MLHIQILISCKLENHPRFTIIIGNLIAGDRHLFYSVQFVKSLHLVQTPMSVHTLLI